LHNNSSSIRKTTIIASAGRPESIDARSVLTQLLPFLFIPNPLPSHQGKSLDYVLAYLVDITVEKCKEKAVKSI
jgi:hypothetical protein